MTRDLREGVVARPGVRETPDIETASDDYAARFAGRAGRFLLERQEIALRDVLDDWRGGQAVDVGGGHAQLMPFLDRPDTVATVLGSDGESLERVRRGFPRAHLVVGDVLELPFADRSVDLVTSVRLVSHLEAWERFVGELCRVSRRTVLIDFPRPTGFNALTPRLFALKKRVEGNTRPYRSFSRDELAGAFGRHRFEVTRVRPQLFLPMVLHRRLDSPLALRATERWAEAIRLTSVFGSPALLRADRLGR